jgi:hypothetical protein
MIWWPTQPTSLSRSTKCAPPPSSSGPAMPGSP